MKKYLIKVRFSDIAADILLMGGFGYENMQKTSKFHSHQYAECHMVCRGTLELETEESSIRLTAGEMCILPMLLNHSTRRISEDAVAYSFLFRLSRMKAKRAGLYERFHDNLEAASVMILKMPDHFEGECQKIVKAVMEKTQENDLRLEAGFILLLLDMEEIYRAYHEECRTAVFSGNLIQKQDSEEQKSGGEDYLWTVEDYIQRHYMEDITVKDLAEHLHLSVRQAERIVRNNAGQSFGELLLKQRMWAAKELLRDPSVRLSEIPALVGFGSYSGFSASVKKFWGMSPRVLRDGQIKALQGSQIQAFRDSQIQAHGSGPE